MVEHRSFHHTGCQTSHIDGATKQIAHCYWSSILFYTYSVAYLPEGLAHKDSEANLYYELYVCEAE